jgi:hypothetical protein
MHGKILASVRVAAGFGIFKGLSWFVGTSTIYIEWACDHAVENARDNRKYNRYMSIGCPRNKQTKILVQTETNRKIYASVVFRFVSLNQKQKILVCFRVSNLYQNNWNKQNCFESNRNKPKQTETTLNFLKSIKICSLSNCFSWSSVYVSSLCTKSVDLLV